MSEEKNYTLKSVQSEIGRMKKAKAKKEEKIKELKVEIRDINKQLKALEAIQEQLYHDDVQRQVSSVLFKGEKLTPEQLAKFMELSRQIRDKIDILDVETATQAISLACDEQDAPAASSIPEPSTSTYGGES
ncbi:MAG: hypothetical protein IJN43_16155 [Ruminococcus sp.]|nr:hypothetical protein [Oscillospiraceae bacterium]MBQ6945832.1 hypothetical protein [Ruminococcus sp.]